MEDNEDFRIDKIIDEFLETEDRPKAIGSYYPSEVGMCLRRQFYSYLNPKKTDEGTRRIFALGNNIHLFITEALKSSERFGYVIEEKPIKMNYSDEESTFSVYGRIDDFIITKDGRKILIEVKSASDVNGITEPQEKHVMQLNLYMKYETPDLGYLVYVDKKNMAIKQFEVKLDEELYKKTMQRFKDLDKHLRNNELPFAEYYFDDKKVWECKYCPYYNECMLDIANNQ